MKHRINTFITVCFLLLGAPLQGIAQTTATDTVELESTIVYSDKLGLPISRNNRNITILTQQEIAQLPGRSVNDILSYVAGIDIRQRGVGGAQADISIDGGTFDQTLLLVDGHKMSDPQTGHNMMNIPVPVDAIERIEILKGPAASRFGVNGLTGVINIITKKSKTKEARIHAAAGSNFVSDTSNNHALFNNLSLQAYESRTAGRLSYLVASSYDRSNGYRYNSSYEIFKGIATADYVFSDKVRLESSIGYVHNAFDARDFYSHPGDVNSTELVQTFTAGLRVPIHIQDSHVVLPYASFRHNYDDYIFVRDNPSLYRNQHHTQVVDAGVDYMFSNRIGRNTVGLNTRFESISSTNLGERSRYNYGLFVENYNRYFSKLDVRLGAYVNYNSIFGLKVYPQVDLGLNVQNVRLYANAGIGQRLPTFTDLYYSSPTNLGNDTLRPEHAFNIEFGTRYKTYATELSASVFHRWGYEMIDWIRNDTAEAWQAYNFSNINTLGVRLQGSYTFDLNTKNQFKIHSAYTYLKPGIMNDKDPEKAGFMSQYSINALKHHWVSRLSWQYSKMYVQLSHKYLHRYVEDTRIHPDFKKQYHIFEARIGYHTKEWHVYGNVQNIFDTKYIETGMVTQPGVWIMLGAQYKLY